jgi:multidrug resistance efflux pump
MSEAIAFDTHRFVKRLTDCGFTEQQAETLADEHVALLNANLATKTDIAEIKADIAEIKADIARIEAGMEAQRLETRAGMEAQRQETRAGMEAQRQETRADIEAVKSELLKWMIGLLIAQGGLIVALVKLL